MVDCCRCCLSWMSFLWVRMMMKIDLLIEIATAMVKFEVIVARKKEETSMMMIHYCCWWYLCCFYDFLRMLVERRWWWYRNFECRYQEVWDDVGLVAVVNENLMLNECHDDLSNCLIIDHQIIDAKEKKTTENEIYFHRRLIFPRLCIKRGEEEYFFIWTTVRNEDV